jgi:hypothetical protein
MRKHGLGEKQPSVFDPLVSLAQKTYTLAKKRVTDLG